MPKISSKSNTIIAHDDYTKKDLRQHIYDLPDTYIGSVVLDEIKDFKLFDNDNKISAQNPTLCLGLYKIFDEICVNAADNTVRNSEDCNSIKININKDTGIISVQNNGKSIPIEIHPIEKIYKPELVFGHLLTSGNYDKSGKCVGGRNGYGSKLTNTFSKWFDVEIYDSITRQKYYQHFEDNMKKINPPEISKLEKGTKLESYIKITFLPDYKYFGFKKGLSDDMLNLFKKRAYDIAGTTAENVQVYYNDELINIKTFKDYIKLYGYSEDDIIFEKHNRWQVAVIIDTEAGYNHTSFVNNICTYEGGTHVEYIVKQIIAAVEKKIKTKHKDLKIKPSQIKDNMTIFINSTIEDPSFKSQIKESLTNKPETFGSTCELSDKFIKKITDSKLIDEIVNVAKVKELNALGKTTDAKKSDNLKNIPKLEEAKNAGVAKGHECTLILTEGDSAKTFAVNGLSEIGREYFGVFPLRGKLLNVREATVKQLLENEEIANIKKIVGLKQGVVYKDTKGLRYGRILILTDQDNDGYHIKGLLMNFIHTFWPSLLSNNLNFIESLATPLIKAKSKTDVLSFYNVTEYNRWKNQNENIINNYKIKYYKGLGTSVASEAKECFKDFDKKVVKYVWDDKSDEAIKLAFAKINAENRKDWVKNYNPEIIIENTQDNKVSFKEFIDKELIHFSSADNKRSLPDLVDGFKPSQRKIIYGCFKKGLYNNEIKVVQLAGYISENCGYHHGEASLQGAITNMAQNFVGSNNINLLLPNGNFGTRFLGGKDAASPRYIFTQLSNLIKHIFIDDDKHILNYLEEDGEMVEPEKYYPIIPLVLVNGCEGIGTGYSTNIPSYNPLDIISNIKKYLKYENIDKLDNLTPWYLDFQGKIEQDENDKHKFICSGNLNIIDENTVEITELPVGTWTQDYINFLNGLVEKKDFLLDYDKTNCNNFRINIVLKFKTSELQKIIKGDASKNISGMDNLKKKLKLVSTILTSNMHLFKNNTIIKYNSPNNIIEDYAKFRLDAYQKRKDKCIQIMDNELNILKYRRQFIKDYISKKIIVEKRKKEDIIAKLVELKYPQLAITLGNPVSYDYLTDMKIFSLTEENIDKLEKDYNDKVNELTIYKETSVKDMWTNELNKFTKEYNKWLTDFNKIRLEDSANNNNNNKSKKSKKSNNTIVNEKTDKVNKDSKVDKKSKSLTK